VTDGSVPIEEFIHAITTQLDRVQDALRLKAVNRPLTYALKDLSMELHVFVNVDPQGVVRFRTSAPNEAGASVLNLGFTTITRPMIEENTVSLSAVRSTPLQELGLKPDEQRRLEQIGVHNVSQLNRLETNAGASAIARLSDVPMDRLREILVRARPQVRGIVTPPAPSAPIVPRPATPPPKAVTPAPGTPPPVRPGLPAIPIAPGSRRIGLVGRHLTAPDTVPEVRLDNQALAVTAGDEDQLWVDLPENFAGGSLEVRHGNGDVQAFELTFDPAAGATAGWAPVEG
jgi:hypothetical protein